MGFEPKYEAGTQGLRRIMPPDRVWLALMYRAGAFAFATSDEDASASDNGSAFEKAYAKHYTFDRKATFEMRYARFRRYGDHRNADAYLGQLDDDLRGPAGN